MALNLNVPDAFVRRHIGPSESEFQTMLETLGLSSLDELIAETVPAPIRTDRRLDLPDARSEAEMLTDLRAWADRNEVFRSFIGMGYHDTVTPPVIQRNVLENPSWYTQYTPYQAEISQGRLEALLVFQTMISDLTGMEIANASLLDEATAAAEAMMMFHRLARRGKSDTFLVSSGCHPQTIEVIRTRAKPIGVKVVVGDHQTFSFDDQVFGALVQYPETDGAIDDYAGVCERAHDAGAYVAVAADLMSLVVLPPPGEFGADVVMGNTQRFGVPMGYGGPHAAYFATNEAFKRQVPGRIIGVSVDADGKPALRMALQTREQHIRRAKATSNICTAQVLLAIMAGMYAVYHGPEGLRRIASRIHDLTRVLASGLERLGFTLRHDRFFDTLRIETDAPKRLLDVARTCRINLRAYDDGSIGVALDETTSTGDLDTLFAVFSGENVGFTAAELAAEMDPVSPIRTSDYLTHSVFNSYHSETEMMRYLHRLAARDLSLTTSMIPLGSCTMKLNAAAELMPVTWESFSRIHPFAPVDQAAGYHALIEQFEKWLAEITGFAGISLQPNAGAAGEYTGMLVIRAYHENHGEGHRNVCLIPSSAHGTNPASAVMAGMDVVIVACDEHGNVNVDDLRAKAKQYADRLAALMITYPSTHGVFEVGIRGICDIIHAHGGQVYMDGANMNAQVGLCRPGDFGADVCHLNLHKTLPFRMAGAGRAWDPSGAPPI